MIRSNIRHIQYMSLLQLQEECRKFNLPAYGDADTLRRRLQSWPEMARPSPKRLKSDTNDQTQWNSSRETKNSFGDNQTQKKEEPQACGSSFNEAINFELNAEKQEKKNDKNDKNNNNNNNSESKARVSSSLNGTRDVEPRLERKNFADNSLIANLLICPITHDLPFEPVTAMDGFVYDKWAIEKHMQSSPTTIMSPIKNQPMSRTLLAAPIYKNMIEALVETGVIVGPLLDTWNERTNDQKLLQKANAGDIKSNLFLARRSLKGTDKKLTEDWFKNVDDIDELDPNHKSGAPVDGQTQTEHVNPSTLEKLRRKNSIAEILICPITLTFPFEPVTAEDGFLYDRRAIEKCTSPRFNHLISPITRQPMGRTLLPAPQYENVIEALIKNEVIVGSVVETWNERIKMKQLLKQAEDGDIEAMQSVARKYLEGTEYIYADKKLAFDWFKKLHDVGDSFATAQIGHMLCEGFPGLDSNHTQGLMYLGMAMASGSDWAAFTLGIGMTKGDYGLVIDKDEAIVCLQKSLETSVEHRTLDESQRKIVQQKLDELIHERMYLKRICEM